MSLLLDALYKASKDKEKAKELSLEPRQEDFAAVEVAPPVADIAEPIAPVSAPAFALELPNTSFENPFEKPLELEPPAPLSEPVLSVTSRTSAELPFPSLELTLEPRHEEVAVPAVETPAEPQVSPEPEPKAMAVSEPEPVTVPTQEQLTPTINSAVNELEVAPPATNNAPEPKEASKLQNPTPPTQTIQPSIQQSIKQPNRIAQLLSRSKMATDSKKTSDPSNKRVLVLGGVAVVMLLLMGGLFLFQMSTSDGLLPTPAQPPMMSQDNAAGMVSTEEITQPVVNEAPNQPVASANPLTVASNEKSTPVAVENTKATASPATNPSGSSASGALTFRPSGKQATISTSVKPNYLAMAYAALLDGRLEDAKQSYAKVLQSNGQEANALLGLAYIAHQRGQREEALGYYQLVLRQDPTNAVAAAAVLSLDTQIDTATASLKAKDLAERQPDSVAALTTAANALVSEGRLADAVPLLQRAQRLEPENSLHVYNHAVALDRLGQVAAAIAQYKKVFQMAENQQPSSPRPFAMDAIRQRVAELSQTLTATTDSTP